MDRPKQRNDGKWYQTLELPPATGMRKRKTFTGATPAEVTAKVDAFKREAQREMMATLHRWQNQNG